MTDRPKRECVYRRDLPGGGFVAIDVTSSRSLLGRPRFEGWVIVERRTNRARDGEAPVVACASGKSLEDVIRQLLPAAQSNATIGAGLVRHSRGGGGVRELRTPLQRFPYGRGVTETAP